MRLPSLLPDALKETADERICKDILSWRHSLHSVHILMFSAFPTAVSFQMCQIFQRVDLSRTNKTLCVYIYAFLIPRCVDSEKFYPFFQDVRRCR